MSNTAERSTTNQPTQTGQVRHISLFENAKILSAKDHVNT